MKQIIYACFVVSTIIACSPKTETASTFVVPADINSYNLDSSANIDLVKKMVVAFETGDSATYRSLYADSAIFHDNGSDMTLDQNVVLFNYFKSNNVTVKVEKVDPIWEIVNKEASPNGITNYVMSFQHTVYKKGDKEVKVIVSVVNGMKDGKIVERVLNATGSSCVETTKGLEKSLGEIESQELLPEYFQDDELMTISENQTLQQQ